MTNIYDSLSIPWNHAISQYSKPSLSLSRSQGDLVIFLIKVQHLDVTVRITLKIHFINSWDRNFFYINTISRQFSRHKFKKLWGFQTWYDFLSMKLMKRKWKERKTTKGNTFYNCPYQHMLQVTKAKYKGVIITSAYWSLVINLPKNLLQACIWSENTWKLTERRYRQQAECLFCSSPSVLWWNTDTGFLPLLALPQM